MDVTAGRVTVQFDGAVTDATDVAAAFEGSAYTCTEIGETRRVSN